MKQGRLAQWESACLTSKMSAVQIHQRPSRQWPEARLAAGRLQEPVHSANVRGGVTPDAAIEISLEHSSRGLG